jgi:hypothetical protein
MGLEGFEKGEANIMRVHGKGISQDIKTYAIVGHGSLYNKNGRNNDNRYRCFYD